VIYKIIEVSTAKPVGETYVLVHFWLDKKAYDDGKPPYLINDFIMALRPMGAEAPDEISPPQPVERDVVKELRANIRAYWERAQAKGWRGDHSAATPVAGADFYEGAALLRPKGKAVVNPFARDMSDPHKILERDDVKELPGSTEERVIEHP